MRYKVSFESGKGNILVEDIIEADEKLYEGYTTRYGVNTKRIISIDHFFGNLLKTMLKGDSIIDFHFDAGIYKIDWLEIKDGVSVMHYDTIECEGETKEFKDRMELTLKWYSNGVVPTREKATKKRLKHAPAGDQFKSIADLFYSYSEDENAINIDPKKAAEIYRFIETHPAEFQFCPSKMDSISKSKIQNMKFTKIIFFGMCLLNVPMFVLTGSIARLIIILMYYISGTKIMGYFMNGVKYAWQNKINNRFTTALRTRADREYLNALSNEQKQALKSGLVDIISMVIEKNKNEVDKEHIEKLLLLEIGYSLDRCKEIDGKNKFTDKYSHVYSLLDVEEEMYSSIAGVGFLNRNSKVNLDHLYDLLRFLGWDRETVLKDEFLRNVISSMKGLLEAPYEGVEVDLIGMIRLAIQYVEVCNLEDIGDDEMERIPRFIKNLESMFNVASEKYKMAASLESAARIVEGTPLIEDSASMEHAKTDAKQMRLDKKED